MKLSKLRSVAYNVIRTSAGDDKGYMLDPFEHYTPEFEIEQQQDKQYINEDYLGGALSAIDSLMKEIASNEQPLKVIKQEKFCILLEEGEKVYIALIALKELQKLRRKMQEFLKEFQEFFKEYLEKGVSETEAFNPIKVLVSKYFR